MVGTRSAVFAPLENLGLIIVDEEQETSYKQEETPRYHGRDTAVYRARLEDAVVLLVPRRLRSRPTTTRAPENIGCWSWLRASRIVRWRMCASWTCARNFAREHRAAPVSESLRAAIALRLEEGTQAMVLINRRGYSWSLLCRSCGAFVQCENCSIALTYHKSRQRLECHYCGYSHSPAEAVPEVPRRIHVFRRRRRRARRGISARAISQRAHRAARSRHGAHQARIPAGAGRVRERRD